MLACSHFVSQARPGAPARRGAAPKARSASRVACTARRAPEAPAAAAVASPAATAGMPLTLSATLPLPEPWEAESYDVPHVSSSLHLLPSGLWAEVAGGVCAPRGFSAQGVHAGLRSDSHCADVALLVSERAAAAAGDLSSNSLAGASATHTRGALFHGQQARAVLMHQGQANVGTGQEGLQDARRACAATADALGLAPHEVLIQSAGALGERPRLDALLPALPGLAARLQGGPEGAYHAAVAMTEGDTTTKEAAVEVPLGGYCSVRLGGMAHASPSGVQAVITCDAAVDPELWRAQFARAAAASFGQLVLPACPGDCLNDSVVGLANGAAGNPPIREPSGAAAQRLEAALTALMTGLAKEVAWDGPSASCLIEVEVTGAECFGTARRAALAVARAAPVRADVACCRPEWASIACALGSVDVQLWPGDLTVSLGGMPLFFGGKPAPDAAAARAWASQVLRFATARHSHVTIGVKLGQGRCSAKAWTYDAAFGGEPRCELY